MLPIYAHFIPVARFCKKDYELIVKLTGESTASADSFDEWQIFYAEHVRIIRSASHVPVEVYISYYDLEEFCAGNGKSISLNSAFELAKLRALTKVRAELEKGLTFI